MNMHAMNMWLTECRDGGCGGGLDFAPMASQQCWESLQARHNTTQVMLGVSLRARWDTTLVVIMTAFIKQHVSR